MNDDNNNFWIDSDMLTDKKWQQQWLLQRIIMEIMKILEIASVLQDHLLYDENSDWSYLWHFDPDWR